MPRKILSSLKRRYLLAKERTSYRNLLRSLQSPLLVDGYPETQNFGDALNVFLGEYLSKRPVFPSRFVDHDTINGRHFYSVIGSICQQSSRNTVVWGSGFISSDYNVKSFVKPDRVLASRGPLTRAIYLKNGVDCPEVFGDPALLLPLIYNPEVEAKYEYGFIPHYSDMESEWGKQLRQRTDTLTINMMIGGDYIQFVQKLKSCKKVVVSSLHGLILCHAYQIPVCWVKLSDNLIGGSFKFNDYLLSVNKTTQTPKDLTNKFTNIEDLEFDSEPIKVDIRPLIHSCPFIEKNVQSELLQKAAYYDDF
ncbi:polysaccharide pyruvyl transferase family protein [Albibacterium indicum]|uniref:polysaccharide pyruvyl transferase family protein n=1 Tax=Albibacterium indicum TaxID=2292082 RepID=UPI000E4B8A72|nr:polysaccharide pyruvyl transferase family protein [Pedobacter indicus]